ncbi:hypothetical protein [Streptomyces aureoverticillatus]|uniref:hypothetical protein n=1 Tax=Streptomyces aureoverticillatus TaxID=66871 RepID=UPI0013DB65DC|nr:hypothetical protein [Streptomyces aureoverticillatus]QIB45798.1 hypothetical protein G3H79_24715 [Streptomyces aureoverticillatus]
MTVAHEEPYDAVDALTLAVTDTPVPEGAHADERFMAEHAAAVADVALLREQLRIVGDALARRTEGMGPQATPTPDVGPPAPKPQRKPGAKPAPRPGPPSRHASAGLPAAVPYRRPAAARRRAVLVLAAVLGVGMLGGVVWLGVESGSDTGGDADSAKGAPSLTDDQESAENGKEPGDTAHDSRSPEATVACMRLVVEGTVRSVEPQPGGTRDRITLDVSRRYKPAKGPERITFPMNADVDPRLRTGDRVLLGFDKGEATPDLWSTGKQLARDREWIEKALPGSRGLKC